jgi:hypothetical protein
MFTVRCSRSLCLEKDQNKLKLENYRKKVQLSQYQKFQLLAEHQILAWMMTIVSHLVFSFKHNVSETGVCLHPQVKAYSLAPEDGDTVF